MPPYEAGIVVYPAVARNSDIAVVPAADVRLEVASGMDIVLETSAGNRFMPRRSKDADVEVSMGVSVRSLADLVAAVALVVGHGCEDNSPYMQHRTWLVI